MRIAVFIVAAYLCGSLPTGVWAGRFAGVDVRRVGSRNIGATNVARTAGTTPAIITLCGDLAKGLVPVWVACRLLASPWAIALVGLAAFFGHLYSIFLRFSGGKGVATGFGVFLAMTPWAALASACVFALIAFATRYVSAASVAAAATLPLAAASARYSSPLQLAATVVAVAIILRHRSNLVRLWRGEEPKFQVGRSRRT